MLHLEAFAKKATQIQTLNLGRTTLSQTDVALLLVHCPSLQHVYGQDNARCSRVKAKYTRVGGRPILTCMNAHTFSF